MMVTAAREADVRAAAAAGAAHYLVKPFEYDDLLARPDAFRQARLALSGVATAGQEDIDAVFARSAGAGGAAQGAERRDGGSGAGGAGPRLRRLLGRVRREGRDLPGERAPLPRALRRAGTRHRAPEVRRRRPARAALPRRGLIRRHSPRPSQAQQAYDIALVCSGPTVAPAPHPEAGFRRSS